jgi:hypothetical protein
MNLKSNKSKKFIDFIKQYILPDTLGQYILPSMLGLFTGILSLNFSAQRTLYLERLKYLNTLRQQAYILFIDAQADQNQARMFGVENYSDYLYKKSNDTLLKNNPQFDKRIEETIWNYHSKMKKAKISLATCAPTPMIEALADYYRKYFPLEKAPNNWNKDVKIYIELRNNLLKDIENNNVKPEDMYLIMFDCDPLKNK